MCSVTSETVAKVASVHRDAVIFAGVTGESWWKLAELHKASNVEKKGDVAVPVEPRHGQLWRPRHQLLRMQAHVEVVHIKTLWGGLRPQVTRVTQRDSYIREAPSNPSHAA